MARSENVHDSTAMQVHTPDHRPPAPLPEGAKVSANSQPLTFGTWHLVSCSLAPGMYVGIGAGKKSTQRQSGFIQGHQDKFTSHLQGITTGPTSPCRPQRGSGAGSRGAVSAQQETFLQKEAPSRLFQQAAQSSSREQPLL